MISMISIISINMIRANMLRNRKLEFRFDTGSGAAVIRSKEEVTIIIFVMKIMKILKIMMVMLTIRSRLVVGTKCGFTES